jgi:hypothetical protein
MLRAARFVPLRPLTLTWWLLQFTDVDVVDAATQLPGTLRVEQETFLGTSRHTLKTIERCSSSESHETSLFSSLAISFSQDIQYLQTCSIS